MRRLEPDAEVYSGDSGALPACTDPGRAHSVIESKDGKAGAEAPGMRRVNIVTGNLKRSLGGTLHAFKFIKQSHRCLAEATWRFNRRFDLATLVSRALVAATRCGNDPSRDCANAKRGLRIEHER